MAAGDVWERVAGTWIKRTTLAASPANTAPIVTSLPASPYDGQEITYQASAASGILWRLRYNASSSSSYKWEFVGGSPLASFVAGRESIGSTNNVWSDLGTVGPQITVPLAGDYNIEMHVSYETPALVCTAQIGVAIGAATPLIAYPLSNSSVNNVFLDQTVKTQYAGRAANDNLRLRYIQNLNDANGWWFSKRYLFVTPVRVG